MLSVCGSNALKMIPLQRLCAEHRGNAGPCFVSDLPFVEILGHLVPIGITRALKEAINPH